MSLLSASSCRGRVSLAQSESDLCILGGRFRASVLGIRLYELALSFDSSTRRTWESLLCAAVAFRRPNTCYGSALDAVNGLFLVGWLDLYEPFACPLDIYRISLDVAVVSHA
jgi:hypothetical protein